MLLSVELNTSTQFEVFFGLLDRFTLRKRTETYSGRSESFQQFEALKVKIVFSTSVPEKGERAQERRVDDLPATVGLVS
jgi:hypothetical protein